MTEVSEGVQFNPGSEPVQAQLALAALEAINKAAREGGTPKTVARLVAEHSARLLGVEWARVWRWDDQTEAMADVAGAHDDHPFGDADDRLMKATAQEALRKREPVTASEGSEEDGTSASPARTVIAVPMLGVDSVIGVVVAATNGKREFGAGEISLLALLASPFGSSLTITSQQRQLDRVTRQLSEKSSSLDGAVQSRAQFLASMGHELRTPLSAIIGFAELILDGADGELTPELTEDILQIQRSGRGLLELINDILDLSKIEAGRLTLDLKPVSLGPVMAEVIANLHPRAEAKALQLSLVPPPEGTEVVADENRLRQVLTNLVANAIKFTVEGGVTLTLEVKDKEVAISVVDTGIGIPAEAQARIFDEFGQGDSARRRFGGAGLGLALTRKLVELQGGYIEVESVPDEGSRFSFTLPRPPSLEEEVDERIDATWATEKENWSSQTSNTVLVVDDDPNTRRVIVKRLQEAGYGSAEAAGASAAMSIAKRIHPAAITLDIMMPGVDGWEVLHALKADPLTRDIPVVVISIVDGKAAAIALGAAGYLTKPFTRDQLLESIESMMPDLNGADVLCVDDDPTILELLRRALEPTGVRVRTASTASEALKAVDERVPDAILADLMIPETSGFEIITQLRARPQLRQVPIIVLSGISLTEADKAKLSGQIDRFVPKDELRLDDLPITIRQAVAYRHQH